MSFLPEDYTKIPSNSDYMKYQEGDNTIRILDSAVVGYEYWNEDNKPVRTRKPLTGIPADCKEESDGTFKFNTHFWAFPVWNYTERKVMILEVTQKTVMQGIKTLVDNPRFGDPTKYDILITKTKEGGKTSYQVNGLPPIGEPDKPVVEAYANKPINLQALFDGGDPFTLTAALPQKPEAKQAVVQPAETAPVNTGEGAKVEDIPF